MSVESMGKALNVVDPRLTPIDRLVLVGIANHDGDGGAWPSKATLCRYTGATDRTVRRALRTLEECGYLTTIINGGGMAETPNDRRPNRYTLHFDGGASGAPPSEATGVPPVPERGCPPCPPAGVPAVPPKPSYEPSLKPSSESLSLAIVPEGPDEWFAAFYAAYPRKVGKPAAAKAYKTAIKKASAHVIGAGLAGWAAYWSDNKIATEFVPHPSTWLNQERWNDAPPPPPTAKRLSIVSQTARALARPDAPPLPEFGSRRTFPTGDAPRAIER
jgi:hypothetical protein